MQGATVQIEYAVKVKNNGEVDYATDDYYKYGIAGGDIVKMKPFIYDYLGSDMQLDDQTNPDNWKEVTKENYNEIEYKTIVTQTPKKDTTTEAHYHSNVGKGITMMNFGEALMENYLRIGKQR